MRPQVAECRVRRPSSAHVIIASVWFGLSFFFPSCLVLDRTYLRRIITFPFIVDLLPPLHTILPTPSPPSSMARISIPRFRSHFSSSTARTHFHRPSAHFANFLPPALHHLRSLRLCIFVSALVAFASAKLKFDFSIIDRAHQGLLCFPLPGALCCMLKFSFSCLLSGTGKPRVYPPEAPPFSVCSLLDGRPRKEKAF
ncbi:hypothetical protein B0H11DRAFT_65344 [Mycena galericulata]|nr:hypothetical protein B0H11DRAFT_65344 [Mycena galericulata]